MAGAACWSTGEMVQPIGNEPRAGSRQIFNMRCWLYCRLSPSLIVNDTYTLGSAAAACCGSATGISLVRAVAAGGCILVQTSRLIKRSVASTAFAASVVRHTPLGSSMNQPVSCPRWQRRENLLHQGALRRPTEC